MILAVFLIGNQCREHSRCCYERNRHRRKTAAKTAPSIVKAVGIELFPKTTTSICTKIHETISLDKLRSRARSIKLLPRMWSQLSEATKDDVVKVNTVSLRPLGRSHNCTQIRLYLP